MFYTNGWFNSLPYQSINTDWVNRSDSHRLALSFTNQLAGGKTRNTHTSGHAEEEGRAGH